MWLAISHMIARLFRWIALEFFVLLAGNLNKVTIRSIYEEDDYYTRSMSQYRPQWITMIFNVFTMFGVYFIYTYLIRSWDMTAESYMLILILSFIHALLFLWDREH